MSEQIQIRKPTRRTPKITLDLRTPQGRVLPY
jgi:hypothetical protein